MTRLLISRAREPDTVVTPGNSGFCIIKTTFRVKGNQAYNTPGWPLDSVQHQGDRKGDCESKERTVAAVNSFIAGRTHFAGIGAQTG